MSEHRERHGVRGCDCAPADRASLVFCFFDVAHDLWPSRKIGLLPVLQQNLGAAGRTPLKKKTPAKTWPIWHARREVTQSPQDGARVRSVYVYDQGVTNSVFLLMYEKRFRDYGCERLTTSSKGTTPCFPSPLRDDSSPDGVKKLETGGGEKNKTKESRRRKHERSSSLSPPPPHCAAQSHAAFHTN